MNTGSQTDKQNKEVALDQLDRSALLALLNIHSS